MLYQNYEETRQVLLDLLEQKDYRKLKELLQDLNEVDSADFISDLDAPKAGLVFRMLPKGIAAEVFARLDQEAQAALLDIYTDQEIKEIVAGLCNDDLADVLEEIPANVANRLLKTTTPERRELVNRLLRYPEDSAGSIMTTEFMRLTRDMTVGDAIHKLRHADPRLETIYTCFVTSKDRILEGVITIRELLTAQDEQIVGDLMEESIIYARTTDDQETASRLFDRYDFVTLPVVDMENRLVGIITIDDALDTLSEESSEDVALISAVSPSEKPYMETGVLENARNRVVWLFILMFSGMINGSILAHYEASFVAIPLLVSFIPMLTDTGGNAGSQSSGLVIRAIALGDVKLPDLPAILWREMRIGLLVGGALSFVNIIRIYLAYGHDILLSLTVSLALYCAVILAKLLGCSLPLLAKACGLDPALMAAPLITTAVDALTLVLYFSFARLLLPI